MIQREISDIIRGLKDPRVGFVTVTAVEMSEDLRHAKVYVSVLGTEEVRNETLKALEHGAAYIRREVGQRIQIRHTPELLFRYDASMEEGARMDRLLDALRRPEPSPGQGSGPPSGA
jgi:ribosome-binding factor A